MKNYLLKALIGIEDGTLNHEQELFASQNECGTAYCLAGWAVHLEYQDSPDPSPSLREASQYIYYPNHLPDPAVLDPWDYCQERYRLTEEEATALFEGEATIETQWHVLTSKYGKFSH
jgi:hypothetical protein